MCIVIDANVLPIICDASNKLRDEFTPVCDWLKYTPKTKFVYGGKKYKEELREIKKALPYLNELRKAGHVAEVDDQLVDQSEIETISKLDSAKCNDAHLIAIIIVSHCRLICTMDKKSHEYLKNKDLYPKDMTKPKIYSNKENSDLLCNKYIVDIKNQK